MMADRDADDWAAKRDTNRANWQDRVAPHVAPGSQYSKEIPAVTAGASAPETLVREVIDFLSSFRTVSEETVVTTEEKMIFKLPRQLAD